MNKTSVATKPTKRHYLLLALLTSLLIICVIAITHTQELRDWYILATYKPSQQVTALANVDTMTAYAKKLFLVNEPQIEGKTQFSLNCPNGLSQTYVIGCYHSGDNGIYLLNVTNAKLNGIIPVTAAYEMLHAGYARLSLNEKQLINKEIWNFYTKNITNTQIHQQMAAYAKTEPGAQYDELYSVLATEVAQLPQNLENHYKIYFNNRSKIISMYQKYQAAFLTRQKNILIDNKKLADLKTTINIDQNKLNNLLINIKNQQSVMSTYQANGDINSYNNSVPGYNAIVADYNNLVAQTTLSINQYNALAVSRNSLALEEQQLVQAINAKPSQLQTIK